MPSIMSQLRNVRTGEWFSLTRGAVRDREDATEFYEDDVGRIIAANPADAHEWEAVNLSEERP